MSNPGAGKPFTSLDAVTGTAVGRVFGAAGFDAVSCQISGITDATVEIQGSNDGVIWDLLEAAVTGDDIFAVELGARYLRAECTIHASGTITAVFVGV